MAHENELKPTADEGPVERVVRRLGATGGRGPAIDLTGRRFGLLTVLAVSHRNKHRDYFWRCQCDCGTLKILKADDFKNKETRSCGCLQLSLTRDGRIDDEQLLLKTPNVGNNRHCPVRSNDDN